MRIRTGPALFVLLVIVGSPAALRAVDTPSGPPPYLEQEVRPKWRLTPLKEVLDEIGREIERPVSRSEDVEELDTRVVLIEESRTPLLQVLELLERNCDLHFVAEPLRLTVETADQWRARQRRLVNLDLRDYGLFIAPGHPGRGVRTTTIDEPDPGIGGPFDFVYDEEGSFDLDVFLDEVTESVDDFSEDVRGTGNLMLLATPEEEAHLRQRLERIHETVLLRSRWRVRFGILPAGIQTAGGIVSTEVTREIASELEDVESMSLSALQDEEVYAIRGRHETGLPDAEINQTGMYPVLNPVILTDRIGREVSLRPIVGLGSTLLVYRAAWRERTADVGRTAVRVPAEVTAGTIHTSSSEGRSSSTVELKPPVARRGTTIELEQRALWSWAPEGEVFLPPGSGLVLLGNRDGRTTAIVIEEVRE